MRLTKIYTKIGDQGTTMLADGTMVPKHSLRIETYGTIDELNSFLGWLRDILRDTEPLRFQSLVAQLGHIQNEMHDLGGELATPTESLRTDRQSLVSVASIARLESEIDTFNDSLPPLANFVLPGGHQANSAAHICRTVCRRAERLIVRLASSDKLRDEPRIYVNRLSDWLFVVSRHISQTLGVPEVLWNQPKKPSR
ncbi:MAG: cob(I)yrinic acid a,c-diamide adenosyltransferase [Proteobacteria bacterium]|nr:cob(I)yrinic acid a,c-diamide adenosyltransferase [Pseudomonadota bacterium]